MSSHPYPKVNIAFLSLLPGGAQFVGRGFVWWWKVERQTQRYGSIWLAESGLDRPSPMYIRDLGAPGLLIAKLLEVGKIPLPHYYASSRQVGQLVPLGEGRTFVADFGEPPLALGVKPTTRRKYNWLLPDCLHFIQTCRVDLLWVPRRTAGSHADVLSWEI